MLVSPAPLHHGKRPRDPFIIIKRGFPWEGTHTEASKIYYLSLFFLTDNVLQTLLSCQNDKSYENVFGGAMFTQPHLS